MSVWTDLQRQARHRLDRDRTENEWAKLQRIAQWLLSPRAEYRALEDTTRSEAARDFNAWERELLQGPR